MNASPHGASVVPNDAVSATQPASLVGRRGMSAPATTSDHTGRASTPSTMYSASVDEISSSTCSTRWNEPSSTTSVMSTPASGALIQAGTPELLYREPADAMTARFLGDALIIDADMEDGRAMSIFGPIDTNAVGANGRATIMLRTEQIAVTALDKGHNTNGPTGRVLSQSFHGARCRLVVEAMWRPDETGDNKSLTVETSSLSAPKVGAVVRLDIIGPAHVLTRDDE